MPRCCHCWCRRRLRASSRCSPGATTRSCNGGYRARQGGGGGCLAKTEISAVGGPLAPLAPQQRSLHQNQLCTETRWASCTCQRLGGGGRG
jgi:hypothetical protein